MRGKVRGEERAERENAKGGKTRRAGNLDSPFPVMTGLFPFICVSSPSVGCLRRHHDEDVSISSSVTRASAIFHGEESDTSFGISLSMMFGFLFQIVKKGKFKRRIKIYASVRDIVSDLDETEKRNLNQFNYEEHVVIILELATRGYTHLRTCLSLKDINKYLNKYIINYI